MRVGIIRCMQTEDYCPGTTDFKMIAEKKGLLKASRKRLKLLDLPTAEDVLQKRLSSGHGNW